MKHFRKTLALALAVLIILPLALASCGLIPPKTADELWERMNQALNEVESYESQMEFTANYTMMETDVTMNGSGEIVATSSDGKIDSYYEKITAKTSIADITEMESSTLSAYHDGKMYIANEQDGEVLQKFSAVTTAEKYWEDRSTLIDFDYMVCAEKKLTQNEDGTWTMNLSGYSESALTQLLEDTGLGEADLGAEISDVEIEITATKKYLLQDVAISFVFEEGAAASFEVLVTYSAYNEATIPAEELNAADYKAVDDLYILNDFDDMLQERIDTKEGRFSLELKQNIRLDMSKGEYAETDIVEYGEKNEKYYYETHIVAENNGVKSYEGDIVYENGVQTVTLEGQSPYTNEQTEDEARAFIEGLIDHMKYRSTLVRDVFSIKEGTYTLTCDVADVSAYENFFNSYNAEIESSQMSIKVMVQDDKIMEIETFIYLSGTTSASKVLSLGMTYTLIFEDGERAEDDAP